VESDGVDKSDPDGSESAADTTSLMRFETDDGTELSRTAFVETSAKPLDDGGGVDTVVVVCDPLPPPQPVTASVKPSANTVDTRGVDGKDTLVRFIGYPEVESSEYFRIVLSAIREFSSPKTVSVLAKSSFLSAYRIAKL
jgi:hypothetical protein